MSQKYTNYAPSVTAAHHHHSSFFFSSFASERVTGNYKQHKPFVTKFITSFHTHTRSIFVHEGLGFLVSKLKLLDSNHHHERISL